MEKNREITGEISGNEMRIEFCVCLCVRTDKSKRREYYVEKLLIR